MICHIFSIAEYLLGSHIHLTGWHGVMRGLSLDNFYQVKVHQAAVEWSLRLDASEFALLLLGITGGGSPDHFLK